MSSLPSTFTTNKGIEKPAAGSYNDTWATPVNADWDDIDNALAGHTEINVTGLANGVYTFTLAQYQPPNIAFIGTNTATLVFAFPANVGWLGTMYNSTSAAVIIAATGGSSITLPSGLRYAIVSDGVNLGLQQSAVAEGPPTAKVGLTSVVGANGTVMDSGSAPALDQSITPVWTGAHAFDAPVTTNSTLNIAGATLAAAGNIDATQGLILVATQVASDNTAKTANTAFVQSVVAPFAPLASPAFTGTPTAPTAPSGNSSAEIANTAFVNPGSSLTVSGFRKNPDGSIDQWGLSPSAGNLVTISLPVPFPNKCFNVLITPTSTTDFHAVDPTGLVGPVTQIQLFFNTSGAQGFWRAFGY